MKTPRHLNPPSIRPRFDEAVYRAFIQHSQALDQIKEYYREMPRHYVLLRYACKRLIQVLTPLVENLREEWEKGSTVRLSADEEARTTIPQLE